MIFSKSIFLIPLFGCSAFFAATYAFAPRPTTFAGGMVRRQHPLATRTTTKRQQTTLAISAPLRRCSTRRWLAIDDDNDDDDDDDEEPLSEGVDSVSWLPPLKGASSSGDKLTQSDSEIIPLFPLGGIVYTPNSEHILNIFEPRYRQMYTDILMNGTKRFAVSMSHPTESGRFAVWGVLFELEDLKEVSEQTADQIKYICNHKVTGRVKLHRILNPKDWESRETYLRAEGTVINDSGPVEDNEENPEEQKALRNAFAELVELQHDLEEDVRFTRASVISLAVKPGSGEDGLWQTIKLWQSFADQRLMARQNELQRDFQDKLQEYLKKEKGLKGEELPRYAYNGGSANCIAVAWDDFDCVCVQLVLSTLSNHGETCQKSFCSYLQCCWISRPVTGATEGSD